MSVADFLSAVWVIVGQGVLITFVALVVGVVFLAVLDRIYRDEPPDVAAGAILAAGFLSIIAWLFMAWITWAEEVRSGGDLIRIQASEHNFAEVVYSNSGANNSGGGTHDMTFEGVTVRVEVRVNAGGGDAERITVTPLDGYSADPPEADVRDGESITIQIIQPMF